MLLEAWVGVEIHERYVFIMSFPASKPLKSDSESWLDRCNRYAKCFCVVSGAIRINPSGRGPDDVGVVGVGWTVFALPEYLEAGRSISRQFSILGNQDMLSLDGLPDKQAVEGVTVRHAGQLMGTGGFIRIWRD